MSFGDILAINDCVRLGCAGKGLLPRRGLAGFGLDFA